MISAINIHPGKAMERKQLRQDLLYRLGVVYLELPNLIQRMDDIPVLVEHFISKCNGKMQKNVQAVSEQVTHDFTNYHWPGNIRELENLIESAMNMIGSEMMIQPWHLSSYASWTSDRDQKVPEEDSSTNSSQTNELYRLTRTLELYSGNLTKVARELNISRNTLYKRLKQYGLDPQEIAYSTDRIQIEETLHHHNGNITQSAKSINMTRQALTYKIKKLNLDIQNYKNQGK